MSEVHYVSAVLIFLMAALCIVPLFQKMRASPILGYLAAGILIGPFGIGLIQDTDRVHVLANLGIVFLLFTIGLELSLVQLKSVWRYIFGLGTLQMILTTIIFGVLTWGLGMDPVIAMIVGAGLAFSSTAFCSQVLTDRGEITSRYGRVSLSILVLQDLAVVPLLTLIPLLNESGKTAAIGISIALLKAVLALVIIMILGRIVFRPLFRYIASFKNPELFMALALLVVLGTSWSTTLIGLPAELGAFLAGVLLAESEYRHQIEAEIRPFKGILIGLFFMATGMSMDVKLVLNHFFLAVGLIILILVTKSIITTFLCRLFRLPWLLSMRIGVLLSQSGEFAFVLFGATLASGFLKPELGQFLLLLVALTMVTTPLMVSLGDKIVRWQMHQNAARVKPQAKDIAEFGDHVIIAGFGRVGQTVGAMLRDNQVPYIALDMDSRRVTRCTKEGLPVFYGDSTRTDLLRALGADKARAVVVTLDDEGATEKTVVNIHHHFPDVKIFVRAKDAKHGLRLEHHGADGMVLETLETSFQLGGMALHELGFSHDEVSEKITAYREIDHSSLTKTV